MRKKLWQRRNKKMKKYLDISLFTGAEVVIENYLDGALADYENGDVENTSIIESCIYTLKFIYANTQPILLMGSIREYEERFERAKELKNDR